jgi:hypothetical protein
VTLTCKFLRNVQANRDTPLGPGRERAWRDVARSGATPRAASVHRHTTAGPWSLGVSPVCVSAARTSRPRLGRRTRAPRGVRALATAPPIRPPRLYAEARRTAPSRAGRFDVKRIYHGARVSAIKAHNCGSRPSTPRSAARHCCRRRELAPPLAFTAG